MPASQEAKEKSPIDQWSSLYRNLFLGLIYLISALSTFYLLFLGGYEAFTQHQTFGLIIWLAWFALSLLWVKNKSWRKIQKDIWPIKNFDDLISKLISYLHFCITAGFVILHFTAGAMLLLVQGFFGLILSLLVMTVPVFGVLAWFRKETKNKGSDGDSDRV